VNKVSGAIDRTFASRILCVLFKYLEHVNPLSVCIQVMCWSGPPEFMMEKLRELELEEEKMQRRYNLELQRMRQFRQDFLLSWKAPNQEAATELGMSKVTLHHMIIESIASVC
jgi:hypothetical protein